MKILQQSFEVLSAVPHRTETMCIHFCDLRGLKIKLRLHIHIIGLVIITTERDIRIQSSIPLQLQYSFHLDVIAQLHVYHP